MSLAATALKPVKVSMMNAIHDLPLLVARDEGFFRDEGLDVDILKTPRVRDSGTPITRRRAYESTVDNRAWQ
jgi:ABC-type nitrate/sulfonate/bicarbonate transport system substrate-binding protein